MYIPNYFRVTDTQAVQSFIKENSFATIVSNGPGQLLATHTPLVLEAQENDFVLYGHVSRANIHGQVLDDQDVLAIFLGPHAYVSARWYDHVNVPTWNYLAVHVYGKASIIEGEALEQAMRDMVDKYEAHAENPVRFDDMPADFRASEMRGIMGFKIIPEKTEAAFKLSQNRDEKNYHSIISHLEDSGHAMDQEVAREMKKQKKS